MRRTLILSSLLFVAGLAGCATQPAPKAATATPAAKAAYPAIPPKKDDDLKLYRADGRILKGPEAMARMQSDAGLVLWLAGNQFFAMDDVVHAFQAQHPGTSVGVITLPPGLLLKAIQAGGWSYAGERYSGLPDVYASVNLGHLKTLKAAGTMDEYATYMHNELVLMVAKGNPKRIRGVADIARDDVRTSMPNPVSEGIMVFYGRKVLERHGLWQKVSGGKQCNSCQSSPTNWFTSVHHRETPERISDGRADTGFVWITETIRAQRQGSPVEAVKLPPEDSLRDEVAYAIGPLSRSPRREAAMRYLAFLKTPAAQAAYAKHGFVNGTPAELELKPIP